MGNTIVATADYGTVVTNIGASKIAACILNGTKLNITHAAVGDGGGAYYKPTTEQEGLKNECWRGEIAYYKQNEANPNMLDVKIVVPAEVGGFTVREAALFDADGDCIAVCNTPDAQKVLPTDGVNFPLTILFHLLVTDASAVEITVNSSLDTVSREEMKGAIDGAMADYANKVGSAIVREITIPADNWQEAGENAIGEYIYTADVALTEATADHFPVMALDVLSLDPAAEAELCPTIETLEGVVRFWAKAKPAADLKGSILLRSENLVDLDTATDEEVDDTVDDIFGETGSGGTSCDHEIATDEEVANTLKDIFG